MQTGLMYDLEKKFNQRSKPMGHHEMLRTYAPLLKRKPNLLQRVGHRIAAVMQTLKPQPQPNTQSRPVQPVL